MGKAAAEVDSEIAGGDRQLELKETLTGYKGRCFPMSMAKSCKRLCREMVETPSLQVLENQTCPEEPDLALRVHPA